MKKLVSLSALAVSGVMFSSSAHACAGNDHACIQRQQTIAALHNNPAMCQYGYNPNCQTQTARSSISDTPPPQVTTGQCQARPQGGKACLTIYKQDPDYKFHLMETNAQGNLVYARFYHVDGQTIKSEQWYNAQGIKHGAFKSYHPNGTQKSLGNFVNGQLQGDYKIHDENGQLIKIEHYQHDNIILEVFYQNGKKHGQETEFDYVQTKKGLAQVIARTAQWVSGVKHGEEQFFETNHKGKTKLVKTIIWQNGKPNS